MILGVFVELWESRGFNGCKGEVVTRRKQVSCIGQSNSKKRSGKNTEVGVFTEPSGYTLDKLYTSFTAISASQILADHIFCLTSCISHTTPHTSTRRKVSLEGNGVVHSTATSAVSILALV